MQKFILSFLFVFVFLLPIMSQQNLVDSLKNELTHPMADSNRAMSMMRLAIHYETVDTIRAFKAYREALKFAADKHLYYQLGRIYQNQAFLFTTTGKYIKAQDNLNLAIQSYQKSDHTESKYREASALGDLSNIFKVLNDYDESVRYQLKCIAILEKLNLPEKIVLSYSNLSNLMGDLGEYKKQEDYARKAVEIAKKTKDKNNLFISYFMLSYSLSNLDRNTEAKTYLDSARINLDTNSNIDILSTYYLVSAEVFKKLNQLDSAFHYFKKCYTVSIKNNYNFGKAEALLQMGGISIQQKKNLEAENYLLEGIKLAEEIHYFNMLDEGYKYLSDNYAQTGRYKLAYEYFKKYKEMNDSVVSMESKKYATTLEKKYESEKKDNQIKLQKAKLQKRTFLNYILIGSAVTLLLIFSLSYRNYKHKRKLQEMRISELETDKMLTATEAVLKGEEQERSRLAKDLHDGLGGMLAGIKYSFQTIKGNLIMTPQNQQSFERGMDMLDSSIKEMRRVAQNMMPESLIKFGLDTALQDYCKDINLSGALQVSYQSIGLAGYQFEQTTAITIYRIIQELINNTLKHASAKTAIVQITKSGSLLAITVEDDGKGFDPKILDLSKGMGWVSIKHRVDFLKGRLDINSQHGNGTSVHIEVDI